MFAAGDVACSLVDGIHPTVMSCQFARPMGRFAGHNVVADLFGRPMIPLRIDWYVTVLDLGTWGALYTVGWDRQLLSSGQNTKVSNRRSITNASIRREGAHARIFSPRQCRLCRHRPSILRDSPPGQLHRWYVAPLPVVPISELMRFSKNRRAQLT